MENMGVEALYGPISLATNRAEYGWARAGTIHFALGSQLAKYGRMNGVNAPIFTSTVLLSGQNK
jgi:hypothetical protein